ncbi:MAG: segregation/condensation protein A [Salinisphaera sp.]|nr:segregation/condensation protein A [Salinisphaera sp.]
MGLMQQAAQPTAPQPPIRVRGEPLAALPEDLYIPPDALRVILEAFEGPLDLLLYLIRRQNLDILDIPVALIAEQYVAYIELMQEMAIELAGEYLLMAAMLAEIKSRMLMPRPMSEDEPDDDPRATLVQRLQEYERFKDAGESLDALPRAGRDLAPVQVASGPLALDVPLPQPELRALLLALREAMQRAELFTTHQVEREPLSVRERMGAVLEALRGGAVVAFAALFPRDEGRRGLVVTFIAVLELAREALVEVVQEDSAAPLRLRAGGGPGAVDG